MALYRSWGALQSFTELTRALWSFTELKVALWSSRELYGAQRSFMERYWGLQSSMLGAIQKRLDVWIKAFRKA